MPAVRSSSRRSGALAITLLASGATGAPIGPVTPGRARTRSRHGAPRSALSWARAREFSSAIFTPCGQTWEQMPQPEQ
jgi:hypothetical protein